MNLIPGDKEGNIIEVFITPRLHISHTKQYGLTLLLVHSMSSERMKKPDHLRFYSYLVDWKYHGR
jgi:hypothetical protein